MIPANGYTFISGNKYRANNLSGQLTNIAVGDYFVHMARNNGRTIIRNNGGKNITYLNVTAYASPAGGFNAADSEEWNVLNCAIKLKSNRVHSINADCMHVNGGRIAPWVENSLFEGFADDCMNLKYIKREIVTAHNPTEITVRNRVFAGETMEFYNPVSGTFLGNVTVNNVIPLGNNLFRLTLSAPVNIQTVTNPEHQLSDKAYVESRSNQSFVFKNNIVRNSRRYGLLLQNKFALIEGNLFQNTSGSAIRIENGVDWGEGFRASNIVINNNVIDNCGFDRTYINEGNSAAIAVDFMRLGTPCTTSSNWCGTQTSTWQAHSNISITNNRIIYNRRGLYLKNINGLTVHNNFICHSGQDITLSTGQNPIQQTILNCSNTSIINLNTTLPTSNVQFLLNETQPGEPIINSGSESGIGLQVNNNGGIITQGHWDTTVGHTVYINTQNNGSLNLINSDNSPFSGNVGGSARTFAFWVKPEEAIFQNFIITGGPANGSVLSVQMEASRTLRVTDNNANIVRMSDMPLDLNVWNHVVISVPEGGTMFDISLYKNGVPSNETFSGTRAKINTTEAQMRLFSTFKGTVSDFRYFDYTLCNGEVEQVYNDRYMNLSTEEVSLNKIKIYPTITNQMIHFSESIEMVEVFDLVGNKLFQEKGNIQQINVGQLSAGMYLIRMNQKETAKIIKK
ncbi:MAG: LamG-like jellyroll fold domain-containing protein [Flavobacterium sp.]